MSARESRQPLALVDELLVPASVLERTCALMRLHGDEGLELLVLWLGAVEDGAAKVIEGVVPPQEALRSEDGVGYLVSGETLFELNRMLSERQLRLLAQVHSHPAEAYHSAADDRWAVVTTDGGFSLVVPDFAAGSPFDDWAVYRLVRGRWRPVPRNEIVRTVRVIDA